MSIFDYLFVWSIGGLFFGILPGVVVMLVLAMEENLPKWMNDTKLVMTAPQNEGQRITSTFLWAGVVLSMVLLWPVYLVLSFSLPLLKLIQWIQTGK